MQYKKIEHEVDTLLEKGDLNPYERKLLRKVKRRFEALNRLRKEDLKFIIFQHNTIDLGEEAVKFLEGAIKTEKRKHIVWFIIGAFVYRILELAVSYAN